MGRATSDFLKFSWELVCWACFFKIITKFLSVYVCCLWWWSVIHHLDFSGWKLPTAQENTCVVFVGMVDCQGWGSSYRALDYHYRMSDTQTLPDQIMVHSQHHQHQQQRPRKQSPPLSWTASMPPFCDHITSTGAAVDIIILILVLGSCGFLFTPYFAFVFRQMGEVLPALFILIGEVVYQAPIAYAAGAILSFISVLGAYGIYECKSRRQRCDNPQCRGLRKSMELNIQLETEQCVRTVLSSAPIVKELPWNASVELGQDPKELEAELRRMAPPNGRAVLIFQAPCGCPAARFEAWGSKKARRSKKWGTYISREGHIWGRECMTAGTQMCATTVMLSRIESSIAVQYRKAKSPRMKWTMLSDLK